MLMNIDGVELEVEDSYPADKSNTIQNLVKDFIKLFRDYKDHEDNGNRFNIGDVIVTNEEIPDTECQTGIVVGFFKSNPNLVIVIVDDMSSIITNTYWLRIATEEEKLMGSIYALHNFKERLKLLSIANNLN